MPLRVVPPYHPYQAQPSATVPLTAVAQLGAILAAKKLEKSSFDGYSREVRTSKLQLTGAWLEDMRIPLLENAAAGELEGLQATPASSEHNCVDTGRLAASTQLTMQQYCQFAMS